MEAPTKTETLGNSLFQETVVKLYAAAIKMLAAGGDRKLTPSQQKAKRKNRASRKLKKANRKRNRR